ncbi:MAG: ArsR family transcriptional regulator [Desulfuromonas sp.]|nr:MAG: ArsR family transcriptional regulator [Desulfuromonas sp.]
MLQVFKALADPTRLRLLALLTHGELSVQDITTALDMGQSRISRHLKILFQAELISQQKQGTWSYYRLHVGQELFARIWPLLREKFDHDPLYREDASNLVRLLESRRQQSREFFDQHARRWDELSSNLLPTSDYLTELRRRIGSPTSLLEIGVGTGALLQELAGDISRLIGIDQSAAMLEEARSRLEKAGIRHADLRLGDMENLLLGDIQVDTIVLNMVLHHAEQPLLVLKKMVQALRPGGMLVIADYLEHKHDWVRQALADVWLGFTTDTLLAWLDEVGLQQLEAEVTAQDSKKQSVVLVSGVRPETTVETKGEE